MPRYTWILGGAPTDSPVAPPAEDFLLCRTCGWNAELQTSSRYRSHVQVANCRGSRAVWKLGDEYVLKEMPILSHRGRDHKEWLGYDVPTTNYVREHTTIPVVQESRYWQGNESHFILMKTVPGESLDVAMDSGRVTLSDLERLAREVVGYLVELRKHTRPTPQSVTGAKVRDLFFRKDWETDTFEEDKEEWWARVKPQLKCNDTTAAALKESYHHQAPYVLTHGDLNTNNIMVKDGQLTGIIDWELSGFYPDWWEWVSADRLIWDCDWRTLILREMERQIGSSREEGGIVQQFTWYYQGPEPPDHVNFPDPPEFCPCRPIRPGDRSNWYQRVQNAQATMKRDS